MNRYSLDRRAKFLLRLATLGFIGVLFGSAASCARSPNDTEKPSAPPRTPCKTGDQEILFDQPIRRSGAAHPIRLEAPGPGTLCIEIRRDAAAPATEPTQNRVGTSLPNVRIGEDNLIVASQEIQDQGRLWQFSVPTAGGSNELKLNALDADVTLAVTFTAETLEPVIVPRQPVTCRGRLRGFEHPLRYSEPYLSPPGRRNIKRAGVPVRCRITFVDKVANSLRFFSVDGVGSTDSEGRYSIVVAPRQAESANPLPFAQTIAMLCTGGNCGNEAASDTAALAFPQLSATEPSVFDGINLDDVSDAVAIGEWDADGDGLLNTRPLLAARLISLATSDTQRNDRPFVIHEQLDIFGQEGSQFMVWGLNGQLARIPDDVLEDKPCDIKPKDLCVEQDRFCNTTHCGKEGFSCPGAPLLRTMLRQGYDVWLVDTLDGTADTIRVAAAAPGLYRKILAYPGSPATASTGVLSAASALQSTKKWMVVSGYSLGGVVARIALLLWERADDLPLPGFVDFEGREVMMPPQTGNLPPIADHVKLYVSIDSPHTGARVPTALQSYIRRIGLAVAASSQFEGSSDLIDRATLELDATPARQLLRERVTSSDELGCWDLSDPGQPTPSECSVPRTHPSMTIRTDEARAFQSSVAALDRGEGRTEDGLPDHVRSIAYSNGSGGLERSPFRIVDTEKVVDLKFDIRGFPTVPDFHHKLFDDNPKLENSDRLLSGRKYQPAGAQWNTSCQRLGNIQLNLEVSLGDDLEELCPWNAGCGPFYLYTILNLGTATLKQVTPTFSMSSANGGAGFPTLVPTQSAFLNEDFSTNITPGGWHDAKWQSEDKFHTNIDDGLCRFVLFYADDALLGDADGTPACRGSGPPLGTFANSCLAGAREPGQKIDPRGAFAAGSPLCDASEVPRNPGLVDAVTFSEAPN